MQAFKSMSAASRALTITYMIAIAVLLWVVPGKSHAQSANVYGQGQTQIVGSIEEGVVLQVAIKRAEPTWQARAGGAAIGAALGNVAASNPNLDWQYRGVVATLGTALGGIVGERVANSTMGNDAQEVIIGLKDPRTGNLVRTITVVQPAPFDSLDKGDAVYVSSTGGAVRVIKKDI